MTGDNKTVQSTEGENGERDMPLGGAKAPPGLPWLPGYKVELPDVIDGYIERPELEARCVLTDRRLTVLHAPGGFGKTAMLARSCRALQERGAAVAWFSFDEEDGPASLAASALRR